MGKYHLKKSGDQFFWNLKAANGEIILKSQMYKSKQGATGGIESCQKNAGNASMYDKKEGKGTEPHYFTLRAGNNEIIGTSEMYASTSSRDGGIASCMKNGPKGEIHDETGD